MRLTLAPSLDPTTYRYEHVLRCRFAETDAMGIVHHGAYAAYLEEARVAFLRDRGHSYEALRAEGVDFAVLELFVQYRAPLRFDEVVTVHLVIGEVSRATFQVAYLLTVEGEVRTTAASVHGAVDHRGRALRLPQWTRDLAVDPDGSET